MAFRIHDSVESGEVDNRVKGTVRGRIWLHGRTEPLLLELKGNAWPDLAGCLLTFSNPKASPSEHDWDGLSTLQKGSIGDLTASCKVRVWDVPFQEADEMLRKGQNPPQHLANCLYLEWFSEANGRVVIESTDYELTISARQWRLTLEEESQRAEQAAAGMAEFMGRLTKAIEQEQQGQKDPDERWDEFDYEKFLKEADARNEKYRELLDKYGDSAEAQRKIEQEMGWARELTEEETARQQQWIEEMNAACEQALDEPEPEPDPSREGIDWVRTESGRVAHPLQHRAFEASIKFRKAIAALGVDTQQDADLESFVFEFQITGAKLAGALGSIARGMALPEPAFTVACLKRALAHLQKCQASLETAAPRKLLPQKLVSEARKELFEIREEILDLMRVYRSE